MSTLKASDEGSADPARHKLFLTPRNVMILALAALGSQGCVPAVLPAVTAGSTPSFVAFLVVVATLDRVLP